MPTHQDRYEINLELVTIAGTVYAMQADLFHYEDVAELEDDILCFLPTVSDLDVFGCELELLNLHTQQPLARGISHCAPATTAAPNCRSLCGRWAFHLFFHEYGRRVGMVPRSSLKEGKNRQMVEKGTKTPNQPKPNTPKPAGRNSTIL